MISDVSDPSPPVIQGYEFKGFYHYLHKFEGWNPRLCLQVRRDLQAQPTPGSLAFAVPIFFGQRVRACIWPIWDSKKEWRRSTGIFGNHHTAGKAVPRFEESFCVLCKARAFSNYASYWYALYFPEFELFNSKGSQANAYTGVEHMAGSLQQLFTTHRNGAWRTGSQPVWGLWCACLPLGYSDYWDCMRSLDLARHIALQVASQSITSNELKDPNPQSQQKAENRKPKAIRSTKMMSSEVTISSEAPKLQADMWAVNISGMEICPADAESKEVIRKVAFAVCIPKWHFRWHSKPWIFSWALDLDLSNYLYIHVFCRPINFRKVELRLCLFFVRRIPLRTNGDTCIKEKMALCADMWWSSGLQEWFPAPDVINLLLSNLMLSWIKSFSWAKVVNELKTLQHTDKHPHTHSNISYVKNLMSRGPTKRPANQLLSCLFTHSTECLLEWDWFLHRTSRQMQNDCFCYEGNQKPADNSFCSSLIWRPMARTADLRQPLHRTANRCKSQELRVPRFCMN